MRASDLAAVAVLLGASMLAVHAQWEAPTITPAEASRHIGHHVRIVGYAWDVQDFGDAGRLAVVADGSAIHARFSGAAPTGWIAAVGVLRHDGGHPLMEIRSWQPATVDATPVTLAAIAAEPATFADSAIEVEGFVDGRRIVADGVTLRVEGAADGFHRVVGLLRYEPACMCYVLHT